VNVVQQVQIVTLHPYSLLILQVILGSRLLHELASRRQLGRFLLSQLLLLLVDLSLLHLLGNLLEREYALEGR
jgi:hypothetical protein